MYAIRSYYEHFVAREAARHGREIEGVSWPALEEMRRYDWPGNVRELRNVIERASIICPSYNFV